MGQQLNMGSKVKTLAKATGLIIVFFLKKRNKILKNKQINK